MDVSGREGEESVSIASRGLGPLRRLATESRERPLETGSFLGQSVCVPVLTGPGVLQVLATLASPFPSLRRSTAEQLYETVVASTELDENLETVLALLAETEWQAVDRDLDGVRRDIAQRLGVVCER